MALTPETCSRCAVAVAALACGVVLAPCGSSTKPGMAGANDHAIGVKFASCMRAHGVPSFPDPEAGAGVQIPLSLAVNPSPAFTSAQRACEHLVPAGGSPPAVSAGQQAAALKFAQCVREHHVPNYPNPTYKDGHQVIPPPPLSLSAFTQLLGSPAFGRASTACQTG
jgi:hypothetical protein